jgi:hypothetical protein
MYNLMTCNNLDLGFLGSCSMAWFSLVIIVFIALFLRRQSNDGILAGTGFNVFGAFGLGIGANVILTAITGSARWSLLGGILGVVIGGYVIGFFLDTSGGEE